MNSEQTENMQAIAAQQSASAYTFEEIIDQSPSRDCISHYRGVLVTPLRFDGENNTFCIVNPLDKKEYIAVSRTTVEIRREHIDQEVLVMFEQEDIYRPVITGMVQKITPIEKQQPASVDSSARSYESQIDETERLVFSANKEIVLQCGKSSIHLTKAGKVIIRGTYLLSRSSGLNTIKGGSVSIN
jgi:hypothetical protein